MTDEIDDWMKPGPPSPWRVLGWRFFGCLAATPLLWLSGRLLPEAMLPLLYYLPLVLWALCLVDFSRARFWRDSRPLWGYLPLQGPGWARWTLRLLATVATVALGLPVFVVAFLLVALPFLRGIWF